MTISKEVFGIVIGLLFCAYGLGQESVQHLPPRSLTASAPFSEVLRQLAQTHSRDFMVGFEKADGADARVTVSYTETPADEIVKAMCLQDSRYTYSIAANGRILHVFPVHPNPLLRGLLDLKLQKVDISADLWPYALFSGMATFAPPVGEYLASAYKRTTSLKEQPVPSGAFASMYSNAKPHHIELHLRDVTVRDLLDAFSLKSFEVAPTYDINEGSGVTRLVFQPYNWRCEIPPANLPETSWLQRVCVAFQ